MTNNFVRKTLFSIFIFMYFCSCTKTIKTYEISTIKFPSFVAAEGSWFIGEWNIGKYEYDERNFFIWDTQIAGCNFITYEIIMDPKIIFKDLKIIEISFIKDNEKIVLTSNERIQYTGFHSFIHLMDLKFRKFPRYFKNMEIGEKVVIKITQKYQFDDGPIITEESDYTLSCFEYEHNPMEKYVFWY